MEYDLFENESASKGRWGNLFSSLSVPFSASTWQQNTAIHPQALIFKISTYGGWMKAHRSIRGQSTAFTCIPARSNSIQTHCSPVLSLFHWANGQSKWTLYPMWYHGTAICITLYTLAKRFARPRLGCWDWTKHTRKSRGNDLCYSF